MKKAILIAIIILVVGVIAYLVIGPKDRPVPPDSTNKNNNGVTKATMILTSSAFNHNEKIPSKFTCDGGNINPELHIQNVPPEAKSLALIVDDPDAVGGRTFTHWLVWNINPKTEIIKQESVPSGAIEGKNDAGKVGYLGPCPPDQKPHRYFFKLYALSQLLNLSPEASKSDLEAAIGNSLIEKTELIGIYER